jgi:hypothetical protein
MDGVGVPLCINELPRVPDTSGEQRGSSHTFRVRGAAAASAETLCPLSVMKQRYQTLF